MPELPLLKKTCLNFCSESIWPIFCQARTCQARFAGNFRHSDITPLVWNSQNQARVLTLTRSKSVRCFALAFLLHRTLRNGSLNPTHSLVHDYIYLLSSTALCDHSIVRLSAIVPLPLEAVLMLKTKLWKDSSIRVRMLARSKTEPPSMQIDVGQHRFVLPIRAFEGEHRILTTVHRGASFMSLLASPF